MTDSVPSKRTSRREGQRSPRAPRTPSSKNRPAQHAFSQEPPFRSPSPYTVNSNSSPRSHLHAPSTARAGRPRRTRASPVQAEAEASASGTPGVRRSNGGIPSCDRRQFPPTNQRHGTSTLDQPFNDRGQAVAHAWLRAVETVRVSRLHLRDKRLPAGGAVEIMSAGLRSRRFPFACETRRTWDRADELGIGRGRRLMEARGRALGSAPVTRDVALAGPPWVTIPSWPSGPSVGANCWVLSTWGPAVWSPLNGVADSVRTADRSGVSTRVEPQSQVERVDRLGRWVACRRQGRRCEVGAGCGRRARR